MADLVKSRMSSHPNSSKCGNTAVVMVSKGRGKVVGSDFEMGNLCSTG